jgi:hypothetical protein
VNQIDDLISRASQKITSLEEFLNLGKDCLSPLRDVELSAVTSRKYQNYVLPLLSKSGRYLRPINQNLFVYDVDELDLYLNAFRILTEHLRDRRGNLTAISEELRQFIEAGLAVKCIYTTLQAIGCILDMSRNAQAARKNFGQRFEDFVKVLLNSIGIANDSFTFKIEVPSINVFYNVPLDLIITAGEKILSSKSHIDKNDTILSVKTSSKDRMKLIFVDRFAMERILKLERINYVALYHNDIQRSGTSRISSTFVPNTYLVYCSVFGELPLYYLDPPIISENPQFQDKIKTFDKFILHDVWH